MQLHNFQEELRSEGYEKIVIIAVGKSVASNFNSNFCANSDLPLVIDIHPDYIIRDAFNAAHKEIIIIDSNQNELGRIVLSSFNSSSQDYIRNIIEENYDESAQGDLNQDSSIDINDIIFLLNMILYSELEQYADINEDENIDILDIIQLINIVLNN